jgi:methylmalonyl-CoA mutase
VLPVEVIRATETEKQYQIKTKENLQKRYHLESQKQLEILQGAAIQNENLFEKLMEATKICSLGQITEALFDVGGQYRRNM